MNTLITNTIGKKHFGLNERESWISLPSFGNWIGEYLTPCRLSNLPLIFYLAKFGWDKEKNSTWRWISDAFSSIQGATPNRNHPISPFWLDILTPEYSGCQMGFLALSLGQTVGQSKYSDTLIRLLKGGLNFYPVFLAIGLFSTEPWKF